MIGLLNSVNIFHFQLVEEASQVQTSLGRELGGRDKFNASTRGQW